MRNAWQAVVLTAALLSRMEAREIALPVTFDFGNERVAPGTMGVGPGMEFTTERGFGWEPGSVVRAEDRGGDALRGDFCTSAGALFFSAALPEGNYQVTVTLGDATGTSATTVKAEQRRLMLEEAKTVRGESATRSFVVNVRTPRIVGGGEVKLKARERTSERMQWDDRLTLEFNGAHPCVAALEIARVEVPVIYLLGDSTVCDQPGEPFASWGQMLPRFFGPDVVVANHAESGETLRSSFNAGRLAKVLGMLRAGDTVLIQFGHNDEKEKGEGVGAFTTYAASLRQYVAQVRKHGGQPVLLTPVQRRSFGADGKLTNSHGDFPEAVKRVAAEEEVPLIDLQALSGKLYEAFGPENSAALFKQGDGTHHSNFGAYELARCVVEGLRGTGLPVGKFLQTSLPVFDPTKPDSPATFEVPSSPQTAAEKPLGS